MARIAFQDLILRLQKFWAERGCMIEMPLDIEVGAGTMHPATFLRVLGPEPWKVAYVQPSRRPADGRYGDNPFRLGKHYQFQVVLKPSPIDVQDIYLDSLRALGLDLTRHDIRFEEDNWESPTLGAWGVGWQVLLDGMEITQFTYFQQAGGIDLTPVSAEITYGIERLTMFLSHQSSAYDIEWGGGFTYGEVRKDDEREFSTDYFFELLTEEIPASMHDAAQTTLRQQLSEIIPGADVYVSSTPRRLIFFLSKLPVRESDREEEVKGPPRKAGEQALQGFLKKNNASPEDIIEGGDYIRIRKKIAGRGTDAILQQRVAT